MSLIKTRYLEEKTECEREMEKSRELYGKPFPQEDAYRAAVKRQEELNSLLDLENRKEETEREREREQRPYVDILNQ